MKVKLKVNIIVAFSALLIATVSIIFFYTQKQTSSGVDQITKDLVSTVTKNVSDETISFLKPAVQIANNLTQNPSRLQSSFQQSGSKETHFEVHALNMLKMYPHISGIFVGDEKGRFLFAKQMGEGKTGIKVIDPSGELFPKFLDLLEDKGLQNLNIIGNQNADDIQNSFGKIKMPLENSLKLDSIKMTTTIQGSDLGTKVPKKLRRSSGQTPIFFLQHRNQELP